MKVTSTELQNNFGKYLMLAAREEIIITRNGMEIAKLSGLGGPFHDRSELLGTVMERAVDRTYGGVKATYEEFLELTKDTEERYEYIDGEIYALASPKTAHQAALTEIFVRFYDCLKGSKCRPFVAPYDITLRRNMENINVVQPDIMVICDLEEKLGDDDYYKGVPALAVEILLESTRAKDMIKKLDLYMSCGVKEYWIVNPGNKEVTIYLSGDGEISSNMTFRKNEIARSYIFEGLSVELDRVFR